jgi:hypothetical protein
MFCFIFVWKRFVEIEKRDMARLRYGKTLTVLGGSAAAVYYRRPIYNAMEIPEETKAKWAAFKIATTPFPVKFYQFLFYGSYWRRTYDWSAATNRDREGFLCLLFFCIYQQKKVLQRWRRWWWRSTSTAVG